MAESSAAVAWLTGLFADLAVRAPHGVNWRVDAAEPPLRLDVYLADEPAMHVEVLDDGLHARMAVAGHVQRRIKVAWDVAVPTCPDHGAGLTPSGAGEEVRWRCPHGDVDCAVGEYEELLWPPRPEDAGMAGPIFSRRMRRAGVTGVRGWSVEDGVIHATVREGTAEAPLRAAAAPLPVEINWAPPVGWARTSESEGETLSITNANMHFAGLRGQIRRSPAGGLQVGSTDVFLSFEHQLGPPGGPLLLDADGVRFADEGDEVACTGGFLPSGPVSGSPGTFAVGRITRSVG